MAMTYTVATVVGSLRKASLNRKVAHALVDLAPPSLKLEMVDIGALPLYNAESDDDPPAPYVAFRKQVAATQAVLFVTPEYNRSVPGALKNALDVGSRPYGHSVWARKPAAIVSASPGAVGGFGANHHLRQSLVFLDVPTLQQPEAYLNGADKLFDADGKLINDAVRALLLKFMQTFALWIAANEKG
jgi:chromate reductase